MSGTNELRSVKRSRVESNLYDLSCNASKALEIVLQQWLIPDMVLFTGSFEVHISNLLEDIVSHEPGGELARSTLRDRLTTDWSTAWDKVEIKTGSVLLKNMEWQTIIPAGAVDNVRNLLVPYVSLSNPVLFHFQLA